MSFEFVLEVIAKTSFLVAFALLVRFAIRKHGPSLRHTVLLLSLLGTLVLPGLVHFQPLHTTVPMPKELKMIPSSRPDMPTPSRALARTSFGHSEPVQESELPWQETVLAIYAAGVSYVLLRYVLGLAGLYRLRLNSVPFDVPSGLDGIEIRICLDESLYTAMTWGISKPVILLPLAARSWSVSSLDMVLTHEYTHVERKDYRTQMLVELVCALYWFNPLVWIASHHLREDAEHAADAAVVDRGYKASDYATELLQLAIAVNRRRVSLSRVGIANMNHNQIESRLKAVLNQNPNQRRGMTLFPLMACVGAATLAITGIASLQTQDGPDEAKKLQTQALSNIKQLCTATIIYANDYDEMFPYTTSTSDTAAVVNPYVKNREVFKSPRKGAEFRYNLNVGGVKMIHVESPAVIPMWYEVVTTDIRPVIGYMDGHAKVLTDSRKEAFEKDVKRKLARIKGVKPVKVKQ